MKSIRERLVRLLCVYINMIVCFKVVKDSFSITDFSFRHVTILFFVTGAMWIIFTGALNKKARVAFIIAAAFLALYLIFFKFNAFAFVNKIIEDFKTINDQILNGKNTSYSQYKSIVLILVPIFTIVFSAIGEKFPNTVLVFISAVMILLWYGGWDGAVRNSLFSYVFASLLTYGCNKYIMESKKLINRGVKVNTSYKIVICYICIFSIVIACITRVLPQEFKGKYGDDIITKFENKFGREQAKTGAGVNYSYGIRSAGYNDTENKLGGPIMINDLTAFKVKFQVKENESRGFPTYFRGTIKDYYTGNSWTRSVKNGFSETTALLNSNEGTETPICGGSELHTVTIEPVEMRTSTIFVPKYARLIKIKDSKQKLYGDNYGDYVSNSIVEKPYDIQYDMDDYKMIENADDFLARGFTLQSEDVNATVLLQWGFMIESKSENRYYEEYKNQKYPQYLQLPDNITPRTRELVQQITNNKKSDRDKAKAIYDYLKNNYQYTLKVTEVPNDGEFLDNFLFTEKKGYCTYFATAATVMCRIAGIPARYVEGFHADYKKPPVDGAYQVTNRGAHAWCEILISPGKNAWAVFDCVPNAESLMEEEIKQDKENAQGTNGSGTSAMKNNRKNIEAEEGSQGSNKEIVSKYEKVIINMGLAMAVIVLAIACAYVRFAVIKTMVVKNVSVIPLYNYTFKRLKKVGIIKAKDTSDLEFVEKIKDEQLKARMKTLVEMSYAEFYGNETGERFNKNEHLRFIERYMKDNQGKAKYLLDKLVF